MGLTQISEWREAWPLINHNRKHFPVLPMSASCAIVVRAFAESDISLGFKVLDKLVSSNRMTVQCHVFEAYWDFCRRQPADERPRYIEQMLRFIQDQRIVSSKRTILGLKSLLDELRVPLVITQVMDK